MVFREACITDIPQIQHVRHAVTENVLSDPELVTDADCIYYLTTKGKGWVSEVNERVVGFGIVDLIDNNLWALFVRPEYENMGFGKQIHDAMLDWYFQQTRKTIWLSTDPQTRAETFYRMQGWQQTGMRGHEVKLEMTYDDWMERKL